VLSFATDQMYCNCCLGSAIRIMGPPWSKVRLSHLRRKLGPLAACMCAHRRIDEQINQSLQHHCQGCAQPSRRLDSPSMAPRCYWVEHDKARRHVRHHCRDPDRELPGVLQFCPYNQPTACIKVVRNALFEYMCSIPSKFCSLLADLFLPSNPTCSNEVCSLTFYSVR
jgi:hypothetical protein